MTLNINHNSEQSNFSISTTSQHPSSSLAQSICWRLFTLLSFMGNVIVAYVVMYETNIEMAQQYFIYVTPSPPFFKIWIVIYITLLLVVIHNLFRNLWGRKSLQLFILSNCIFIISSVIWYLRNIQFVAMSGLVLAVVDDVVIWFWRVLGEEHGEGESKIQQQSFSLGSAITIQSEQRVQIAQQYQKRNPTYTHLQLLIVRNILSFYIGWITVAGTIQTGLVCVYWWGLSLCQQFIIFWITTPIAAVGLYLFLSMRFKNDQYRYCFGYIISVSWGLIGASIASVNNITQRSYC